MTQVEVVESMQVDDEVSDREDRDDRQSVHSDQELDHDPEQPAQDPEDGKWEIIILLSLSHPRRLRRKKSGILLYSSLSHMPEG